MSPRRRRPAETEGAHSQFRAASPSESEIRSDESVDGLPEDLRRYLPGRTADAWVRLSPLMPASSYLIGGTGLTVYLKPRISRDLDFMLEKPEDIEQLRSRIAQAGTLAVTHQDKSTLNGIFEDTKIQ